MASYDRRITLYINGKEVVNSVANIRAEMNRLQNLQNRMTIGSQEYINSFQRIQQLRGALAQHNQQISGTTSAWSGLVEKAKGLLPAFGFAAIASGATYAFSAIKNSTHATADAFEFAVAGMRTGLDFFWKTLATGDWSNFFTNLNKAIEGGYKYAEMLDEVADNNRALRIIESKARGEELRLEEALKNKTLSTKDRLQAGKDRIALEEKLSLDRQAIANKNYKAEFDEATRVTKLNEDQLLSVAGVIDSEQKLEAAAYSKKVEDYEKLKKLNVDVVGTGYGGTYETQKPDTQEMINLKSEIDSTQDAVKNYAGFLQSYDIMTEEQQNKLIAAVELRDRAVNSAPENLKKVITRVNSLMAGLDDNGLPVGGKGSAKSIGAQEIAEKREVVEAANKSQVDIINKNHIEGKTSEAQYKAELLQQEFNFLQAKMNIYKKGSKEYEDAAAELSDKQVKTSDQVKDLLLKAEKELADAKIENLQDGIEKEKIIENKRWDEELKQLKANLIVREKLADEEIAINDTINQTIIEKKEAHDKKMKILNSANDTKKTEKKASEIGDILDNADSFATSTPWLSSDQIQVFFDERRSVLEQAYQLEQELAGANQEQQKAAAENYNKELKKIKQQEVEVTYDAASRRIDIAQSFLGVLSGIVDQESALGKALFLFQQGLAIASIWISVAKANAAAMATLILPPLYLPVIAANTTMGVVQTALVVAQTVGSLIGDSKKKASGGYMDNETIYTVGEAGAEWVAPNWQLKDPRTRPLIGLLESFRQAGSSNRVTVNPELIAMTSNPNRISSGGSSISTNQSAESGSGNEQIKLLLTLAEEVKIQRQIMVEELKELRSTPIKAEVAGYGGKGSVAGELDRVMAWWKHVS